MPQPIVCVDLNGVLDSYQGWQGADRFDPPRAGAREFRETLGHRGYTVVVFTTRYADDVWQWLATHGLDTPVTELTVRKPAAGILPSTATRGAARRGRVS